ncbi:MAG: hypothetical protein J6Y78_09750 [Paludibacteraceae bacterium]|nr:hypothetical protein [Paludibacteraceae bacterium]
MTLKKDGDEIVADFALKNGLDMEQVLASYLIMGDNLFYIAKLLEGKDIHVPSKAKFNGLNRKIYFLEDDERKYAMIEKGTIIHLDRGDYKVIASEKKILNHYYLPLFLQS